MKTVCDLVCSNLLVKSVAISAAGLLFGATLASQSDEDEEEIFELSPFEVSSPSNVGYRATSTLSGTRLNSKLGATVGGAQDIRFVRSLIESGQIPDSASFTPEGLFSEHDLPIGGSAPEGWLFDIASQAVPFDSKAQPDVQVLAQLGFVSGIDAATFNPAPLNLVAVVDKSGSMSGQPLELVRKSLTQAVSQMGIGDQLSIVLYGRTTHVHLEPTKVNANSRAQILDSINRIQSHGSTAMEAGLQLGYEVAKNSMDSFEGKTRLMLFTDERPNVGRTDSHSFMGMATEASESGIGLTTIGVSTHFGAELAEKISSVRGGNLFYFNDEAAMEKTFSKEFDTMVLELAYDMNLRIAASDGMKITGLYGIPGDAVTWEEDGSLNLEVSTIFASRNKGAIYVGFGQTNDSQHTPSTNAVIGNASITYTQADNNRARNSKQEIRMTAPEQRQEGIVKGTYLVDQYASMKLATLLYESEKYGAAAKVAIDFAKTKLPREDANLEKEHKLATELAEHLKKDCKNRGIEIASNDSSRNNRKSDIVGEWIESNTGLLDEKQEILRITAEHTAELYNSSEENPLLFVDDSKIEISKRYLVFNDWGRTFRYRLNKENLELRDGDVITTYTRKASLLKPGNSIYLNKLQRTVSGLPEVEEVELFSLVH